LPTPDPKEILMSETKVSIEKPQSTQEPATRKPLPGDKQPWETPKLEDVSEEVMAQPYIRFT
jgi:hypothetical protein